MASLDDVLTILGAINQAINNIATDSIPSIATGLTDLIGAMDAVPSGATPITGASGNVAAASAVATLTAGGAGVTTWITGFDITSGGATAAAIVNVTVANTTQNNLVFTYGTVAGAAVLNAPLLVRFNKPIPANATNTAITVTLPSIGAGNTNATVNAYGYYL